MINWRLAGIGAVAVCAFASVGSAQGPRRAMSGDLTKPLAQYTGDEFFALTQGLQFGADSTKPRACRGTPACNAGGRVQVSVAEVSDADSVSAGTVSQFGTVTARALNRGNDQTVMYNIRPQGRYRYYLIVQPSGTWVLEELDIGGANRAHQTVASGRFTPCAGHTFQRGARADFRTCAQAQGDATRQTSVFRYASFTLPSRQGSEPPIWIGCASGCCTADQ